MLGRVQMSQHVLRVDPPPIWITTWLAIFKPEYGDYFILKLHKEKKKDTKLVICVFFSLAYSL